MERTQRDSVIFGAATQDVNLCCLLTATSSPSSRSPPLFPPPPRQVIKNSACGVRFLAQELIKSLPVLTLSLFEAQPGPTFRAAPAPFFPLFLSPFSFLS